jgi:hypothetical protein
VIFNKENKMYGEFANNPLTEVNENLKTLIEEIRKLNTSMSLIWYIPQRTSVHPFPGNGNDVSIVSWNKGDVDA